MATTILERPYKYCFSRNEIRYVFEVDNLTRPGLFLQIIIMYHSIVDTTVKEMPPFKLKPNTDGKVYFPMQAYIDSMLSYVLPSMSDTVTNANAQCCKFWVVYREISESDPNPSYIDTENSYERLAIKGGISKEKFARNNFFTNYFDTQKPWFTWQPQGRFVFIDQPLFLTAFFATPANGDFLMEVDCYTTDNDTFGYGIELKNLNGVLFHFNLNKLIKDNLPEANYAGLTFRILDIDGQVIINNYTLNFHYRPLYNYQDLIFHNSTGGIDTVRVRGEIEQGINKEFEETQGGFAYNESLSTTKSFEQKHRAISFGKTFKGEIGFLNNKREQDALIELLISRSIYEYKDLRFIPVLNIQKATPTRKSSDELFSFPIDFTTSIKEENYTPEFIELGIGDLND